VDREIKEYADTLYLDALFESGETVRKDRVAQAQKRALSSPTPLPISGVDIQNAARIYEAHVERCMDARLHSYQSAYADTARTPSEEDFSHILAECKAVWDSEVQKSTKGLKELVGSHSPVGAPVIEDMVRNGSGRGHDRVLRKFKIWKAKIQLKPLSAKDSEPKKDLDALQVYSKIQFERDLPSITSKSSEAHPCSLLFLDIDRFKSINDTLGHQAGDRVLKIYADTLRRVCDDKGAVYRNGGDEFCVLLPNHSLDEAFAVASRILREVRAIRTAELPSGLTTSIGAACIPECAGDHGELLERADRALYASKKAGRDQASKAESAEGKNSKHETPWVEKKAEVATPDKRITELSRDPYTEELKRIAKQVVDFEMTLEGRHVLRHLMIHEPVEVGRTLVPEIPQDRTYAQLAIAKERGLVQHKEEGRGLLHMYWIINPKFRQALQDVLYEGGTN
jgi:diguanylate cyclase (GGDEF)-like protein